MLVFRFHLLPLLTAVCLGQTNYPADTILASHSVPIAQKILVTPIAAWQRLSYNVPFIGCQFYPSCSNYAAQSIAHHGVFLGIAMSADRIVRCNPAAFHYHRRNLEESEMWKTFHSDGRMLDPIPVTPISVRNRSNKSPALAALLSSVIPGAGRMYSGRPWDGFFGFLMVTLSLNATYANYQRHNRPGTVLFGLATIAFYSGEIFGAYRAASQANP